MGISGLKGFLKKRFGSVFRTFDLRELPPARYALDAEGTIHQLYYIARKRVVNQIDILEMDPPLELVYTQWSNLFLSKLLTFARAGHLLIPVFDGPDKPAKQETTAKRIQQTIKSNEELEQIRRRESELNQSLVSTDSDPNETRSRAAKLSAVDQAIPRYFTEQLQQALSWLGIPYLVATGEAERLCAQLAIDGYVLGVVSRDSDCLAHGTPLIIDDSKGQLEVVELSTVLQQTQLTYDQLLDWCIMSGCDFNVNLPRVGIATAYKHIRTHGSIEKVLANLHDVSDESIERLNHRQCRELFRPTDCPSLIKRLIIDHAPATPTVESLKRLAWSPPDPMNMKLVESANLTHWLDRWYQVELPRYRKYKPRIP